MRLLLLFAASSTLLAQDAHEIVRRAVELDKGNDENWRSYSYFQRQIDKQLEASGKVKTENNRTWEVSFVDGSPYRKLVARNDKPLSPEEQKAEDDRMTWAIGERRKEPKEQRERRIAAWRKRQDQQREPLAEVPDAFDFQIAGEEKLNGLDTWVIDATPKRGYKPKSANSAMLPKLKARFWVSKRDFHWMKLEAETLDTFAYGAFVLRIGKGAHIVMEQARVSGDVWLPTHIALTGTARILFVKSIRAELDMTYRDYRKATSVTSANP